MRVIFMGTPEFAKDTLQELINSKHEVVGVFTQPDKPKGRGKKLVFSPIKELSLEYNLPIYQPLRLKNLDMLDEIKSLNPDCIVVAAFGQILPKEILELPPYGCINVHASLLPKYRGAAPINWCIINKEDKTGITIMKMDEGLDTGDMLNIAEINIDKKETSETLTKKLSKLGANLLIDTLNNIDYYFENAKKQEDKNSTYAPMIKKSLTYIDFDIDAHDIDAIMRGYGAMCILNGKRIKFFDVDVLPTNIEGFTSGSVIKVNKDDFWIQCKKNILVVKEVQEESKKRIRVGDFLRGNRLKVGDKFEKIN